MDPLDVLQPNYLGDSLSNLGVGELIRNRGVGVKEARPVNLQATGQSGESGTPAMMKDKLRTAKAREFGQTKETVGF